MNDFTRLTVIGTTRKAELVVPSDEAIGALLPRLLDLLEEPGGPIARPLTLSRSTGEQLDLSLTAGQQLVEDGECLRLLRLDAAPPSPSVADVTDVVAESLTDRNDLWSAGHRRAIGAAGIAAAALLAGLSVTGAAETGAIAVLAGTIGVLLLAAVISGRLAARWIATGCTAAALGLTLPLGLALSVALPVPGAPLLLGIVGYTALLGWVVLGLGAGAGLGVRSALWGASLGAPLAALPLVLIAAGVTVDGAVGVTGVVAAVACGMLPWYAMSAAGLTGLDDQVSGGRPKPRDAVLLTVTEAYRGLTWSTAAVALTLAPTGLFLALRPDNDWAVALGAAIAVVTALRTRAFPLAVLALLLWLAAGSIVLVGTLAQLSDRSWLPAAVLAVLALVGALAVGVDPSAHSRASLRRFGNFVEGLAVVALLPLLLGVFAVYAQLLGTF
ncbi:MULTISPECIES: EsaB/YukD family protein [Cryobacterium]|uniref:EccD-like transmembrane domain-containing protein n=1 Tax=Cryobacterium breve TaxID=1259258 RepID=A0ABY2IZ64_9MICO|nr:MULTISPECIES: EsaB/YukD family protein [Cryobacterium]TFC95938.1 hypothetical protein E3T20_04250 [Cryobacterium sp. TmT3-12]TFC97909.1 hypothetical protein E3O65_09290 [Cryobacterium breve]